MQIKKAVIPAAGLGVRFLPATKSVPKEMLPIVDKPTIQYIVEEAVACGISEILVITSRNKKSVEDHFDAAPELEMELEQKGREDLLEMVREISDMVQLQFIRQKHPRGLGHAVSHAKSFVGSEPFAVFLGDEIIYHPTRPCIGQLMDVYERYGVSVLGVQPVPGDQVHRYGIIASHWEKPPVYGVTDMVEKPAKEDAPSNLAALGRYVITPDIFDILEHVQPGAGGEIQLTDALKVQARQQKLVAYAFEGKRYDAGEKLGYLKSIVEFALMREDIGEDFAAYIKELAQKERLYPFEPEF
ncbi:MAG: UTP--glucose-1-phosphate uridylyltransferase GalU [Christensenellales bacterium]|jgi:UTP--glucose-1-phosphate uridylyltransferase